MRAGYRVGQFARGLVTGSVLSLSCCAVSVWYGGLTQASRAERRPRGEGGGQLGDLTASPLLSSDKSFEDVNQLQNTRSILKYGVPDRGPVVRSYIGHSLGYDQARKIPVWVAEHLTPESVKGSAHRKHSKFKADPNVPPQFSASNKDFLQSGGWSRGHMAPAGDFKHNQASMDSTFYLTNVVPQNYENNAGFWNRFEMYCRDLTNRFTDVRIFTGPLFLPNVEKDGKLFVQYQVIGQGLVAVPTHLYKLVLAENNRTNEKALGAFIVPNEPIGFDHSLKEYKVPLESLETKTGVTFLPLIDKTEVSDLCKLDSCELLNKQKFDLYVMGRRMANATTKEKVEKVWGELKSKGLEPDAYITELYDSKLKEMDSKEKKKSEL